MNRKRKGFCLLLGAAVCCACLLPGFSAAALPGYTDGRLSIVTEPEDFDSVSAYVTYYKDDEEADPSGMTWVDGRNGKALLLDGKSEYLRLGYQQLKAAKVSFAAWVNWKGAPEGADESAELGQRLFTMSRSDNRWLTFSPHARDTSKTVDGGYLDGVYLEYYFAGRGDAEGTHLEQFNAAQEGISYALPKDEWHHVAVVSDEQTMKVYIDGRLWFEDIMINSMVEMQALTFKVGAGISGGYLHAAVDDVGLYEFALSAEQVAMLAAGVDPLEEGATLPPEEEPYLPTEPVETSSAGQDGGTTGTPTIFGLPVATVCIVAGLIVVVVGLSVFLSIRSGSGQKKPPASGKGGGGQ